MTVTARRLGSSIKRLQAPDGTYDSTLVPIELLQAQIQQPVEVTIGGTSNRTFTLKGSAENPVVRWMDQYPVRVEADVAYSWVVGTNTILNSDGESTTLTNGTTGVWYMYLYLNDSDVATLVPSKTAPKRAGGPHQAGYYYHPGTGRDRVYAYVGFMLCDATTPTFIAATKRGYQYSIAAQAVAVTTAWAAIDFSLVAPAHQGVEVSGTLKTSTASTGSVAVGTSSVASQGAHTAINGTDAAQTALTVPYPLIPTGSDGNVYGIKTGADTANLARIAITRIRDVV